MNKLIKKALPSAIALALLGGANLVSAAVNVQCPGDTNGDSVIDTPDPDHPNAVCTHLIAGDNFSVMSDGNPMYIFGFADRTGDLPEDVIANGILDAEWPGTTIELDQGDEFYLSLSNVGTVMRPDLFDPHTVHFHGFPNAGTVFDGVPEVSISINHGATLTYYYNIVEPGTYIYHCHVEASEHMEMGMLANLYVHPIQDETGCGVGCAVAGRKGGPGGGAAIGEPEGYTYNDGDGTTGWDVEKPLQVSSFDPDFHDASIFVQPLPFAALEAKYPMINGRGYPQTLWPMAADPLAPGVAEIGAPMDNTAPVAGHPIGKITGTGGEVLSNGSATQTLDSVVTVPQGQTLLLRLSNVSIDRFYTLKAQGLPMKIVATGSRQLRGVTGKNLYRDVSSVNFGGGETHDVLIDTTDVAVGTYFLHSAELHQMSNLTQLDGGMITEIEVLAP